MKMCVALVLAFAITPLTAVAGPRDSTQAAASNRESSVIAEIRAFFVARMVEPEARALSTRNSPSRSRAKAITLNGLPSHLVHHASGLQALADRPLTLN